MRIDLVQARSALEAASGRTADLLDSISDGNLPVTGSKWTMGEVGAHLVVTLQTFTQAVEGSFEAVSPYIPNTRAFPDRLAAVTAGSLELVPERHPGTLATFMVDAVQRFLGITAGQSPDSVIRTPWYGPRASLSLGVATCSLLAEQVVHGYDIARTVGRPWPISRADALLTLSVVKTMIPLLVNPDTTRGHTASYQVRVRGGPQFVVRFRDGAAVVEPVVSQVVDCHLSADPMDLMLVVYGRIGQWGPMARGQLWVWGRKPWLGLSFKSLFVNP